MNVRRFLGVGLLAVAGCAGSHKPATSADPSQPPVDDSKWVVSGPSPEALAKKTGAYAVAAETGDPFAGTKRQMEPRPPQARFIDPANRTSPGDDRNPAAEVPAPVPTVAKVTPIPTEDTTALAQLASDRTSPRPAHGGNEPQNVPESADFVSSASPVVDTLQGRLHKRVAENPTNVADQLDLQLYNMISGGPPTDQAAASALSSEDMELVDTLLDGLRNFRSTVHQDQKMLEGDKIKPLLEMADRLRSQAGLIVHGAALCRRVDNFGKYVPFDPPNFPSGGNKNDAIVYCEVDNFLPMQNSQGLWETKLSMQVTLYSEMGVSIWSDSARPLMDQCRNRRHDFFATNIIHLPPTLPIGKYTLNVHINDQNANCEDEAKLPLWIVAK